MPTADEVIVEFEARVGKYEADLRRAAQTFERTTNAQQSRMAAFERRMSAGASRIGAALAGIATIATAREFLRMVDAGKQLEAQLKLATRESGSFAQAQDDVRRIATQTRTGLEETAQLYATFQRNALQLDITQEQVARATETVTKTFQISGASAAEAAGGLRQFLQGIQSGTLRGEELNSVLENAPRLAKLLADSLGVTVGQLRAMGQEGDLAADKLIDALTNRRFTDRIDAEFRELPVTFDQAMQQIENAAIITFSAFDRGGGFSQMLANFVTDGADGFADLEQAAVETGIDIRSTFEGLANAFDPLLDAAREVFSLIGSDARTLADRVRPILGEIDWIANRVANSARDAVMPGDPADIRVSNLQGRFDAGQAAAERRRRGALADQAIQDMFRGYDVMGNRIAPAVTGGGVASSGGRSTRRRSGPSAESIAAKAERERLQAIREEGSKQADLLSLQDDIIAARKALATAAEDIARFELQQLGNEQAARLTQLDTERRLGELTQDEYNARAGLLAEEIALRRQAIERQRDEAVTERELDLQREALRMRADQMALEADALLAQADIADTLEQRRFLEESALAYQQEIERALLEQAIAEGRIADASAARAALATRQSAEMRGLEKRNQGALGRYLDDTADTAARAEEAAVREMEALRDGLAEGLADQLGTKNQFVRDLFSIFLDEVIFRPLAESLRSAGGGGGLIGGLVGLVGSIFGGGRAIGGPVRPGRAYMVGENGPEPFIPQQAGVIVPNRRLQAQGGGNTVISSPQFDLRGAVVTADLYADMERISRANAAQAGVKAYRKALKDTPVRMSGYQRYGR